MPVASDDQPCRYIVKFLIVNNHAGRGGREIRTRRRCIAIADRDESDVDDLRIENHRIRATGEPQVGGSEITETPERSAPTRKCIDGAAIAGQAQEGDMWLKES
ncbi:hypothetical protein [Burkholderia stagnalis]|uniref:hypothetical protein n=1 Tax=Burkholderia stagnalis TaxID=1503054 RepID=UPI000A5AB0AC|nr:hypothetical protein [Burkholderia stagnalis]